MAVAIDVLVVQLEGVDLKEEEVKQDLLVIKEVLVAPIEGVDDKVDEGLLVKEVVIESLFVDFEPNQKKETTHPLKRKNHSYTTQLTTLPTRRSWDSFQA